MNENDFFSILSRAFLKCTVFRDPYKKLNTHGFERFFFFKTPSEKVLLRKVFIEAKSEKKREDISNENCYHIRCVYIKPVKNRSKVVNTKLQQSVENDDDDDTATIKCRYQIKPGYFQKHSEAENSWKKGRQ